MNAMQKIRIEKLTLNIGSGKEQSKLEKGMKLIKHLTGTDPVKTITNKRIPNWGLRPGLPIGCKLTIRNGQKLDLIKRLLKARNNKLNHNNFDDNGSVSFGVHEYIDIPGISYNPDVGIMGFQACITLERPGFRVKKRRLKAAPLHARHKIKKNDAMQFMKDEFDVDTEEGDEE
jgi:large subunit ribosomal protein L5